MGKPFTEVTSSQYLNCLQANVTEFTTLEKVVRQGSQADSPNILCRYFELADTFATDQPRSAQIYFYTHVLDILLETICDGCIKYHWRQLCLDYCYKPLIKLNALASNTKEKQHARKQQSRLRTLSHYFC